METGKLVKPETSKLDIYVLLIIIGLLFLIRVPYLDNPPFERYEMWRQSDTESMARNFIDGKFNIFYPQLNYEGPAPNYVQLEFQITTFIIAILYKFFGFHYELARLVPTLFFLGSVVYLYQISNKYFGMRAAVIATLLYGLYPLNIFFSRAVMPESAALFFFIGGFYYFDRWIASEKNQSLGIAAIFTTFAISIKIPTVFVGIPLLAMSIHKYKQSIFKKWQLYIFAVIALLVPFLYFNWLEGISNKAFVTGIATNHIFRNAGTAFFSAEAYQFYTTKMPESLTWIGIALFIVGLFFIKWKKDYPIGIWALAMIIEVVLIVAVIRFNYYLIFITPLMALVSGKFLASLTRNKIGLIAVTGFMIGFGVWNYYNVVPRFELNDNILGQAAVVKEITDKDDLILIGTLGPELLNASNRHGWRFHLPNDKGDLESASQRLNDYIEKGANYFVPAGGYILGDQESKFKTFLEENFEKIEEGKFSFYRLQ